jgi:SAM-dependent methyltransferase
MFNEKFIEEAILKAEQGQSKLTNDILALEGMSSSKVRHLLNNLLTEESRYLEVGVWKGSTHIAALYGNAPAYHMAIDNWSEFGGPKDIFLNNCLQYLGKTVAFLELDFFESKLNSLGIADINTYFYDGGHTEEDHYLALTHVFPALAPQGIILIDDYNNLNVQQGTLRALKELPITIDFSRHLPARHNRDKRQWWNGFFIGAYTKRG